MNADAAPAAAFLESAVYVELGELQRGRQAEKDSRADRNLLF